MFGKGPLREVPGGASRQGINNAPKLSVASATTSMAPSQRDGSIAASTKLLAIRLRSFTSDAIADGHRREKPTGERLANCSELRHDERAPNTARHLCR
jgi:hypothetical protein